MHAGHRAVSIGSEMKVLRLSNPASLLYIDKCIWIYFLVCSILPDRSKGKME